MQEYSSFRCYKTVCADGQGTHISNVSKIFPVLDGFLSFLVFFKFPEIQISAVKYCLSFAVVTVLVIDKREN